jgi:DNA invertase Pin-like site-specific DNA recombinase
LGPEAQRAAIESWAAHEGVSVVDWYVDQGVSGATPIEGRPALLSAIAALRGGAGLLVVAKRDRIARDLVVGASVDRIVCANGARLVSADGLTNAEGVEGMMLRGVQDLFAAIEREMIRARTRSALAAKARRGERVGAIPYGYRLADDGVRLERNEQEQTIIGAVIELRAAGLSQRLIVVELAARGVVSRSGAPLGETQVARILARRAA